MKLQELPAQTIHRTGVDESVRKSFNLATSKKTFKILSSTIYKHKIRAIIREVSCNAIDGHVAAGHTLPFDVQMPTILDPRFIVRDYGTGLTHEQMHHIYQTYFESTKTDSNDFIGALGLGSKSPFCYSDTFTVESVVDGVKSGYVAYMEDGFPFLDDLYTQPTDEPNGVKVIVPVNVDDVPEWENEANRVYQSFTKIKPNFTGVTLNIKYQPSEPEKGKLLIKHNTKYYNGMFARMGNIMYPIDKEMYEGTLIDIKLSRDLSLSYIIDFPLGSLDFMPSREELSLDKITRANIKEKLDSIDNTFYGFILADFEKMKTLRDKISWYEKKSEAMRRYVNKKPDFWINGKSLYDYHSVLTFTTLKEKMAGMFSGFWANGVSSGRCEYQYITGSRYKGFQNETSRRQRVESLYQPWKQKNLYVIDMDVKTYSRIITGFSIFRRNRERVWFVEKPVTEKGQENLDQLIQYGFFEESEIIHLKASEMLEEEAAYIKDNPPMAREKSFNSSRPKTPNVIMLTMEEDGSVSTTDMFMSRSDFLEVDALPAVRLYGAVGIGEYHPLGKEVGAFILDLAASSRIDTTMKMLDINQILVVRNSLWDLIPNTKLVCLDELMKKTLIKSLKTLKPNTLSCAYGEKHRPVVSHMCEFYGITLDRLVKNRYNEKHDRIARSITKMLRTTGSGSDNVTDLDIQPLFASYQKMRKDMAIRVDQAWEDFKEMNPVLDNIFTSSQNYGHIRKGFVPIKNEISKLIRWK